jgi:hypothetical protein
MGGGDIFVAYLTTLHKCCMIELQMNWKVYEGRRSLPVLWYSANVCQGFRDLNPGPTECEVGVISMI